MLLGGEGCSAALLKVEENGVQEEVEKTKELVLICRKKPTLCRTSGFVSSWSLPLLPKGTFPQQQHGAETCSSHDTLVHVT